MLLVLVLQAIGGHQPNTVLKDNDLREPLRLHGADAAEVIEQLTRDSSFLCEMGIMDYSLLIGVSHQQVCRCVGDDVVSFYSVIDAAIGVVVMNIMVFIPDVGV